MAGPPRLNTGKFSIAAWAGGEEGEKCIIYGPPGIGKTTLAALAPSPVFIGVDDGGRKYTNPVSNEPLQHVAGVATFDDVRDVLRDVSLFADYKTVVIDSVTELERWALDYLFRHYKKDKGTTVKQIEDYGFHTGYRRWHDIMRLILSDCAGLVRANKNVVFLAQSTIIRSVQAGSEDFLIDGPELYHDKKVSTMNEYVSWADHVWRIAVHDSRVDKDKKVHGGMTRAIYVHPEPWFVSKSRTITDEYSVVSFDSVTDDSIWRLLPE